MGCGQSASGTCSGRPLCTYIYTYIHAHIHTYIQGGDEWDVVNPLVVRAVADLCAHVGSKGLLEGVPGCAAAKDLELAAMCIVRQLKGRRSLDLGDEVLCVCV